jgi:hypothetical protein
LLVYEEESPKRLKTLSVCCILCLFFEFSADFRPSMNFKSLTIPYTENSIVFRLTTNLDVKAFSNFKFDKFQHPDP